jgi:hypothetical protein
MVNVRLAGADPASETVTVKRAKDTPAFADAQQVFGSRKALDLCSDREEAPYRLRPA